MRGIFGKYSVCCATAVTAARSAWNAEARAARSSRSPSVGCAAPWRNLASPRRNNFPGENSRGRYLMTGRWLIAPKVSRRSFTVGLAAITLGVGDTALFAAQAGKQLVYGYVTPGPDTWY